jgi:hypothetical protein
MMAQFWDGELFDETKILCSKGDLPVLTESFMVGNINFLQVYDFSKRGIANFRGNGSTFSKTCATTFLISNSESFLTLLSANGHLYDENGMRDVLMNQREYFDTVKFNVPGVPGLVYRTIQEQPHLESEEDFTVRR